jgi:hypothetical protein
LQFIHTVATSQTLFSFIFPDYFLFRVQQGNNTGRRVGLLTFVAISGAFNLEDQTKIIWE